jgi:hypothetical protein
MESMRLGKTNEDTWIAQQTRQNDEIDEWGTLPGQFSSGVP